MFFYKLHIVLPNDLQSLLIIIIRHLKLQQQKRKRVSSFPVPLLQ